MSKGLCEMSRRGWAVIEEIKQLDGKIPQGATACMRNLDDDCRDYGSASGGAETFIHSIERQLEKLKKNNLKKYL